jgi:hypothetical protein
MNAEQVFTSAVTMVVGKWPLMIVFTPGTADALASLSGDSTPLPPLFLSMSGRSLFGKVSPTCITPGAGDTTCVSLIGDATTNYFSLAATSSGTLYSWGRNNARQLGLGDTTNRTTPTVVAGVTAVSAGGSQGSR